MSTLELIKQVKAHPVLYDVGHCDYVRKFVKDRVWTKISRELGFKDGADAKLAWQKLRNCHRDALRRKNREMKSNPGHSRRKWRYEPEMRFLLKYMHNRYDLNLENDGNQKDDGSPEEAEELDVSLIKCEKENDDSQYFSPAEEEEEEPVVKKEETEAPSNDELYHFFMSMFELTKKLPPAKQIGIKRKVFEMVTEAQEETLETDRFNDDDDDE